MNIQGKSSFSEVPACPLPNKKSNNVLTMKAAVVADNVHLQSISASCIEWLSVSTLFG